MDKYIEKVAMLMEDALSEDEAAELKTHLAACQVCQAEQAMLKRIDQLFMSVPMVAPPPNFVTQFEMRLERRINRRRTWTGVSIISLILIIATTLLLWSVADSGLTALSFLSGFSLLGNSTGVFESTLLGLGTLFKAGLLAGQALLQITRHPVFWGYIVLAVGIISLWAQMLRRFNYSQQLVISN